MVRSEPISLADQRARGMKRLSEKGRGVETETLYLPENSKHHLSAELTRWGGLEEKTDFSKGTV